MCFAVTETFGFVVNMLTLSFNPTGLAFIHFVVNESLCFAVIISVSFTVKTKLLSVAIWLRRHLICLSVLSLHFAAIKSMGFRSVFWAYGFNVVV